MAQSRQKLYDFEGLIVIPQATICSSLISMAATFSFPFYRTHARIAHLPSSFCFRPFPYLAINKSSFGILRIPSKSCNFAEDREALTYDGTRYLNEFSSKIPSMKLHVYMGTYILTFILI